MKRILSSSFTPHRRTYWSLSAILSCVYFAGAGVSWGANEAYYNYLRGMVEERAGNTAKALEAYEKVVQEDPQALQVYRDIAELHLRLGQADAALRAAEHVKDLAPEDPTSFIFLGNVRVAQGELAKAAEAYEMALKIDPTNLRALENLGNYYAILDPDKSLTYFQRYIAIEPRDADIYFQMALVYAKKGSREKASSLYKKALEVDPQQLAAHLALADLYEEQKSTAAAISEYQAASELQSSNPLIFIRLGSLFYRNQNWEEARKAFDKARELAPQDATAYYWLARVAEEKKSWKDASGLAIKAYDLSQDPQFLPLVSYYLTLDRQLEPAVTYLEKARAADPNNSNVLLFLGMDYLDLNKPEKAKEALEKGVELFPKDTQMRFQLGITEDRLGHFDEAVRVFQNLLAIDPKNAPALNYLGYSWADRGEHLEEAEKLLRQAVAIDPESGAYLDSLGWVRYKQGDPKDARNWLVKAALLMPDPLIFDHLGDACLADGHPEISVLAWSSAIRLDPKSDTIRKKLQEEGGKFLNSQNASKFLLFMEGNLKQIESLRGKADMQGKLGKRPLQAAGTFTYDRPDRLTLVVQGAAKTGPVHFSLRGSTHRVEPAKSNPFLSQMVFHGLTTLGRYLSGQETGKLATHLDPERGVEIRFNTSNPSGGEDEIQVFSNDFAEGLWLPSEIRTRNTTIGWEARLSFSEWEINGHSHPPPSP